VLAIFVALVAAVAPAPEGTPREPLFAPRADAELRIGALVFEGSDDPDLRRALEGIEEGGPLDLRAVREAVRTLHTSRRFSRVAAFVEPMAEKGPLWVRLVFSLTPVLEVRSVTFPGHSALAESALKSAAGISGPFHPAQLRRAIDDVIELYRRAGYRRVQLEPVQRPLPGGVALEIHVREGPPTRIGEVSFEGDLALTRDELRESFRLQRGDVLIQTALEDAVRSLRDRYRRAGRLRARVFAPSVADLPGDRVRLAVRVAAGPRVSFHVRGNRVFSDRVLLAQIAHDSDEPLDAQAVQEMAGRLRSFYRSQGFLRARIAARELPVAEGGVQVFFSVAEDRPVPVEQIRFTGHTAIPERQLVETVHAVLDEVTVVDPAPGADPGGVQRSGIAGRVLAPRSERYHVDPHTIFDPVLYARAIRQIEDLYKSQGYLNVQVGPPRAEELRGAHRLAVVVPVREGDQARVASVRIEGGGGDVTQGEVEKALSLQQGGVFSYLAAEDGRSRITQLYTSRGHIYAKVEDDEAFEEPDARDPRHAVRVHVTYRVQPGPLVRVAFLKLESPEPLRTVEGLIMSLVSLKPGDVLRPDAVDRAQQALLRTGLFFSATLTPLNPEIEEPEKVVQIHLRERPTQAFLGSVGFSLTDGPRTTLQFQWGNLWGRNLTFGAVGKADFPILRYQCVRGSILANGHICTGFDLPSDPIERVIDFGLSAPRLYPLTDLLRGSIDLIHERAIRPAYRLTKYSAQTTVEWVRRRPISFALTYEIGYQSFSDTRENVAEFVAPSDRRIFLQPQGEMIFGSLRPTVTLDLRDEPGRTRKGFFAQIAGDYMRSLTEPSFHANLMRLQALAAGYLPLPFASSLVLQARGGHVFHLDDRSKTPGDRRFYLGGALNLRAFPEDGLQPEDARKTVRKQLADCQQIASGVACTPTVLQVLQGTSAGGELFVALRAEARLAVYGGWELALFYDAGNLIADPGKIANERGTSAVLSDLFLLHDAAGFGLRYATPIGRMALDLGFNLRRDDELNERTAGVYFSIDTL